MSRSEHDPGQEARALAGVDKLIHEPGRLAVISFLAVVKEADFLFLMNQTGLTRGNLSAHMAKLEKGGYVEVEKAFVEKTPRTTYRLTAEGRRRFEEYRRRMLASLGGMPAE